MTYCSCFFFWRLVGFSAPLGELLPRVNQIYMFLPSTATFFQSKWNKHLPAVVAFFPSLRKKKGSWKWILQNVVFVRNVQVCAVHFGHGQKTSPSNFASPHHTRRQPCLLRWLTEADPCAAPGPAWPGKGGHIGVPRTPWEALQPREAKTACRII